MFKFSEYLEMLSEQLASGVEGGDDNLFLSDSQLCFGHVETLFRECCESLLTHSIDKSWAE